MANLSNLINQTEIKRHWQASKYSFGEWIDELGQVWKNFVHPVDELFMVVKGQIELQIGKQTYHSAIVKK